MGRGGLGKNSNYEDLRNARIAENQARLASIGLENAATELHAIFSSRKSFKTPTRKYEKTVYDFTSLRRSDRLRRKPADPTPTPASTPTPTPTPTTTSSGKIALSFDPLPRRLPTKITEDVEKQRPANAPLVSIRQPQRLPPHVLARRCDSKSRGSVYDSVWGICCHFCRQKKLCGEEDCKRCGNGDIDQPCMGKTDCSVCHSSTGVLCRACLKVRYGEEMEIVRKNKKWMCPHCIEAKGINPYWICNSSLCLKKRKIAPTGIAIFEAREKGFKSVAHLLMEKLKEEAVKKRKL